MLCRDVMTFARVGPPVLFVVEGMNLSSTSPDINEVCGSAGCSSDSLVSAISRAAQDPANSHIGSPAASWIDDFLAWIQPELPDCCREHTAEGQEGTRGASPVQCTVLWYGVQRWLGCSLFSSIFGRKPNGSKHCVAMALWWLAW